MISDYTFANGMLYNKNCEVAVSLLVWGNGKNGDVLYKAFMSWGTSHFFKQYILNANINKAIMDKNFDKFIEFLNVDSISIEILKLLFNNLEIQWISKYKLFKIHQREEDNVEYIEVFKESEWLTGDVK